MKSERYDKLLHTLRLPPPFGVKSHACDGRQILPSTKLKNLTSSVKIPDFHNLKIDTF